ncbi:MAG: MBL fold metallo-hydrolase [Chloroflexota bacterium]
MRLHTQVLQIGTDWGDAGHTKLYLLEGEKKAIVDTGVATSPARDIAPYLAYYGYKLSDIDIILNTHGHHDHAGGNVALAHAEVYIHEDDAFLIEDPIKTFDSLDARFMRLMAKSEAQVNKARTKFVSGLTVQKVARALKDGDVVDLGKGSQIRVVSIPGHTMGSVGFLWEREGMFFTGDSAMGQGSRPGVLPSLYFPLTYIRTLEKLLKMPIGLMALGHYFEGLRVNSNPIKKGDQVTLYLQDCQEICNRIMESMGKAILRNWGAPFPVVLADALDYLSQHLKVRRDPATGVPKNAVRRLGSCYLDMIRTL